MVARKTRGRRSELSRSGRVLTSERKEKERSDGEERKGEAEGGRGGSTLIINVESEMGTADNSPSLGRPEAAGRSNEWRMQSADGMQIGTCLEAHLPRPGLVYCGRARTHSGETSQARGSGLGAGRTKCACTSLELQAQGSLGQPPHHQVLLLSGDWPVDTVRAAAGCLADLGPLRVALRREGGDAPPRLRFPFVPAPSNPGPIN